MLRAIKIKLYPNKEQTVQFNKLLGCYRFVFNNCLQYKKDSYDKDKTSENLASLGKYFHNNLTKQEQYKWLSEQNTKVLKQAIINMLEAYKRFFDGKGKIGFPKFKSKHDNKLTCRFPIDAISKRNDYGSGKLSLANIKNVKFRCSDKYKNYLAKYKKGIKSATLTKTKSGDYYLSILVDGCIDKQLPKTDNVLGIDLGIKHFVITSDGEVFDNLKLMRTNEKKLVKLQKQLSKKQKGSNNRNKARIRLAKAYEKLNNKKKNYLHEISNSLLNENQVIVMEHLNVSGIMKNHKLAKSIQELSLYEFRRIMDYKSKWYGRELVIINRYFASSKLCNICGFKNNFLSLHDREWTCPQCGTVHDRDINAALNIKAEGLRIIGSRTTKLTLVENLTMDDKVVIPLKSSGSLKQEELNLLDIGVTNFL